MSFTLRLSNIAGLPAVSLPTVAEPATRAPRNSGAEKRRRHEKVVGAAASALPSSSEVRDRLKISAALIEQENGSYLEDFSAGILGNISKEKSSRDESIFPAMSVAII